MNELIKIKENENGIRVSSARELHSVLDVKTSFPDWIKRMFEFGFTEGLDFISIMGESTGGRPSVDYALTENTCEHIAMVQRTEKGKIVRQYYIDSRRDKIFKPKSRLELAKENVLLIEEIEIKDALLLEQTPKILTYQKMIDTSATYTVDTLSDAVDIGKNTLLDILRSWNWVMKKSEQGTLSTRYSEDNKFGRTLVDQYKRNGKEYNSKKFVLTRKGFELAIKKLNK